MEKNLKQKMNRDIKVIKDLMLHKLTHLRTNFVLVYYYYYYFLHERVLEELALLKTMVGVVFREP